MGDIEDFALAPVPEKRRKWQTAAISRKCGSCGSTAPTASRSNALVSPITTSVFELLKIGIGPSSSHTVGPMIACRNFVKQLGLGNNLGEVSRIRIILRGSLALTGIGHYTDKACILGLTGVKPADVDTSAIDSFMESVRSSGRLHIGFDEKDPSGEHTEDHMLHKEIEFDEQRDILLLAEELPLHPNGMICTAFGATGHPVKETRYYSIGGGFILTEEEMTGTGEGSSQPTKRPPVEFNSMNDLIAACKTHGLDIAGVMRRNEEALRPAAEVEQLLEEIWDAMEKCVDSGLEEHKGGNMLPGPLGIMRRAPEIYANAMSGDQEEQTPLPSVLLDELRLVDCYALAVMEENATMGRVVTAPTNGAAGIVPAVLTYYMRHLREKMPEARRKPASTYLLTAAAVGILAKENACISGAAGGCQAEVGTASAMAAAGLCAALGGTPDQVEEAAEIALEHSLGMTCDPIMGLVQVPCIERNTMGATKAVNAVSLALKSSLKRRRSTIRYDDCLRVMKETGKDMNVKYRETAQGGLAADYEESLRKQPPEMLAKVQEMMGLVRISWGVTEPDEPLPKVTLDDKVNIMARSRANSVGLANC